MAEGDWDVAFKKRLIVGEMADCRTGVEKIQDEPGASCSPRKEGSASTMSQRQWEQVKGAKS